MSSSLVTEIRKLTGLHYVHPRLPLNACLPSKLSVGSKIHIHGAVLSSPTRFSVNLKDAEVGANTFFHFNPRFGEESVVVRNSRFNDAWGAEEREGDSPFLPGMSFVLTITVQDAGYEITVNGEPFTLFEYRDEMPLENVTHLTVKGDIACYAVIVPGSPLELPLSLNIPKHLHVGDQVLISGEVPGDSEKFAINLQCGHEENADVMFHFNPRFGDGEIVCNNRLADTWESEQRESSTISPGQSFVLSIGVSSTAFHASINNQKAVEFAHRVEMSTACVLTVNGGIIVNDLHIISPPITLPPMMADCSKEDCSPCTAFCEALPFRLNLPTPLEFGKMVVINCSICPDTSRFIVNLQSDDGENIALHLNPRWDDDSGATTVLNTKSAGEWGSEERIENSLEANTNVAIVIYCKEEGYSIAYNGEIIVPSFEHRVDIQTVSCVVVDGCVSVHEILVA